MEDYKDILDLPHHRSSKHQPLSAASRAAQFSPFAALAGFEAALAEAARLPGRRRCLGEDEAEALDAALRRLARRLGEEPWLELRYFVADPVKPGGTYVTRRGQARRLDPAAGSLQLKDGSRIPLADLVWLRLEGEEELPAAD